MPGIYFHIPFCRQACHYCDFHFSTSVRHRDEMILAMVRELEQRKEETGGGPVRSIYFGGGTPSILSESGIDSLLNAVYKNFQVAESAEITLEANPDDLSGKYLGYLSASPVNRLSIGIQSFFDEHLKWMNRAHTAREAMESVGLARERGFSLITIDLIYGFRLLTTEQWLHNLSMVKELGVPHFSAYSLTVEPGTVLGHRVSKKLEEVVKDEQAAGQFMMLSEFAAASGYRHYEISNLALPGFEAVHNSSYWRGEPYLGIGPSAHSFNGTVRRWNISNNALYIKGMNSGKPVFESELPDQDTRLREKIMTGLRMIEGISRSGFSAEEWQGILSRARKSRLPGVQAGDDRIFLSPEGRLFADAVAVDLFP